MGKFRLGTIILFIVLAFIGFTGFYLVSSYFGYENQYSQKVNLYKAAISDRTAFYDNILYKALSGKAQVTLKADSGFYRNVNAIMAGRKDGQGVMMKWITEQNPNMGYEQVLAMYKDLSNAIEGNRASFVVKEENLMAIDMEINNLLDLYPSKIFLSFGNHPRMNYKPITSDRTDDVMRTGKDNNVSVF